MDPMRNIYDKRAELASIYVSDKDRTEKLRLIMQKQLNREVSYEEAQKAAIDLIDFYKTLAQGKKIVLGGIRNKARWKEGRL